MSEYSTRLTSAGSASAASVGIDIGATTVKLGIVTSSGKIIHQKEMETDAGSGPAQFIKRMISAINELIEESKANTSYECWKRECCKRKSQFRGIGIGCPSWDGYNEAVGDAHNLPGFKGLAIGKITEKELGLPTFVDNDANAAADGERIFGGWGRAGHNLVVYTLGTGVGGGVIHAHPRTDIPTKITGHKFRGAELGHITIALPPGRKSRRCACGHPDCLEAHASATAVSDVAKERIKKILTQGRKTKIIEMVEKDGSLRSLGIQSKSDDEKVEYVEARHVSLAGDEGDELALKIEDETAYALAEGIRNAVQAFDPEIVVIAGKMGIRWKRLVEKAIKKYRGMQSVVSSEDVRIEISKLENAGILGAAALASSGK
ncbi:ROK family protein [bacterium]|nr:ROK family protein [bacterium]MCK4436733.1 ROK family protein [bacterium]